MKNLQISPTAKNAIDLRKRYLSDLAGFLTDIVRMDLDKWQKQICDEFYKYDRFAVSSGHSSGKSALTAGIIIYFLTMYPHPQAIITANTEKQLSQKTWRELAKWHKRSLLRDWFNWSATKFALTEEKDTWFAAAVPQTEHSSEAFAGAHEKYMLQIFDEASSIPYSIYEVSEGATATAGGFRKWLIFGNPTQNSGPFYDACFGRQSHRWHSIIIDTRECKYADQVQIKAWIEDWGLESDFVRVRVLGLPPQQSVTTLIGAKLAEDAAKRELDPEAYRSSPKILSVDVARYGDDETVWSLRQGLKLHWQKFYHGLRETQVAERTANIIDAENPMTTFFDVTGGYGAGAYDILRDLGYRVVEVNFASRDGIEEQYQNMRISMWDMVRKWLALADIPDDFQLLRDLTTPELMYNRITGRKQLEDKKDLKKRLGRSPDRGDSLAIGFAYPVRPIDTRQLRMAPPPNPYV